MFSEYESTDLKIFTNTIGNLLPLSQSINSSLQNDSFIDKKNPPVDKKRRGYINGSHSEIEVSQIEDWNAKSIYDRGMKLLKFLENNWNIKLTHEQKESLMMLEVKDEEVVIKNDYTGNKN